MTYFPGGGSGGGIPPAEKGAPNGVATLDSEGKLTSAQIYMAPETQTAIDLLETAIDARLEIVNCTWDNLANKPTTFLPSAHNHVIADVTGLQAALDAKQPTGAYLTSITGGMVTTALGFSPEPAFAAGTAAQYRRGDKSWQTLDKTAVGLANVDNTSDANKPISSATQTALNAKEPTIAPGTTSQFYRGDKTWQTLPTGGGSDPWTRLMLAADFVNATVTFNDVTGLTITIPATTDFVIEFDLLLAAVATANLPRVGINWSAALAWGEGELWYESSATAKVFANGVNLTAAGNLQMAVGTAPVVGVYGAGGRFKGRTGGAQVTIKVQLAAESAAANGATMKAKSEMRVRQL